MSQASNGKFPKLTASDILSALASKHAEDVFVPECKDGPTQSVSEYFRLDAWVMNRSWANPVATGYEIKVSRSDFLKDNKWRAYLALCNQFYFVCPRELIKPSELPPEAGLYYVSNVGNRLFVQKKAPHREVEIPDTLYRYILMCRSAITRDKWAEKDKTEFWKDFVRTKAESRRLGYEVSKAIREHCSHLETENMRLVQENKNYEGVKEFLNRIGVDYHAPWSVERKIHDLQRAVPPQLESTLKSLIRAAECFRAELNNLTPTPHAKENDA